MSTAWLAKVWLSSKLELTLVELASRNSHCSCGACGGLFFCDEQKNENEKKTNTKAVITVCSCCCGLPLA